MLLDDASEPSAHVSSLQQQSASEQGAMESTNTNKDNMRIKKRICIQIYKMWVSLANQDCMNDRQQTNQNRNWNKKLSFY